MRPPEIDPAKPDNLDGRAMDAGTSGAMQVPVMTPDGLKLSRCRLIKIDAEGMERAVIQGGAETIRRYRPLLYVENNKAERSAALIDAIGDPGYRLYWHFSPYFRPGNVNKRVENAFPNTADPNMLCLPVEVESALPGLGSGPGIAGRLDQGEAAFDRTRQREEESLREEP